MSSYQAHALSRRTFLRLGTWGTLAIATTSGAALTACSSAPPTASKGFSFLRDGDLSKTLTKILTKNYWKMQKRHFLK